MILDDARLVRSSCKVIARRSCMSTCTVTSRNFPILKIGIRSMLRSFWEAIGLPRLAPVRCSAPDLEGILERRLRDHVAQIYSQMDDSLCNLWTYPADNAISAHEACSRDRFEKVLRHQSVDGRNSRDINDRDHRARLHDALQKTLHDNLGRALSRVPINGNARMCSYKSQLRASIIQYLAADGE